MNQIPMEYLIYFQFGIDLGLIMLIIFFIRYLKNSLASSSNNESGPQPESEKIHNKHIDPTAIDALESLMKTARNSAVEFERLINEKKMLISILDKKLAEKIESQKKELSELINKGESVTAELKKQVSAYPVNHTMTLTGISGASKATPPLRQIQELTGQESGTAPLFNSSGKVKMESDEIPEYSPPDKNESIIELASRGIESSAISARLGIPIGEVELILSLNRRIISEKINAGH